MKTYDILNAGPKNRFMANGRIVSNSGRIVQLQNLPQNKLLVDPKQDLDDLDLARRIVLSGDGEWLENMYGDTPSILSQLIRTMFIPQKGHIFVPNDFAAIEARVIAWLSGEKWRLDVFNGDGRIYEASAAFMFHVDIDSITYLDKNGKWQRGPNYYLRAYGKVAELAFGFGGALGAGITMGGIKMGMTEKQIVDLVVRWRGASPKLASIGKRRDPDYQPGIWDLYGDTAKDVIKGKANNVHVGHGVVFFKKRGNLYIKLPSGRLLAFVSPSIVKNDKGYDEIVFWGLGEDKQGQKKGKHWQLLRMYGGKFFQNVVQGIARDLIGEKMIALDEEDYRIPFHVHDEIVGEMLDDDTLPERMRRMDEIMCEPISWAPGLPLKAEGFKTKYYKKD